MRTVAHEADDFQSIAQAYLDESVQGGGVLQRFIERYPQYAEELTMLALETAADDGDVVTPLTPPSHLFDRLRRSAQEVEDDAPYVPASLIDFARDYREIEPPDLAERLDIGLDVLALLDERQLPPSTIPLDLYTIGAAVLDVPPRWMGDYCTAPPTTAVFATAYHAPDGLSDARSRTFIEAIEESPLTTAEQKSRWRERMRRDDGT